MYFTTRFNLTEKKIERPNNYNCNHCQKAKNKMLKLDKKKFTRKATLRERRFYHVCFRCAKELIDAGKYENAFLERLLNNGKK